MARETIAEWWASFAAEVLPADAPDVQRIETRRAFYAGAQGMLSLLVGAAESDAEGDATIRRLDAELATFAEDVLLGIDGL